MVPEGRFHAMDMRQPHMDPQSFTNAEYFARLRQSKETHRERIWDPDVRVHGSIATVWAPYDFWTDGKFSHCGVDAFDLIKTSDGWKISGGAFTMEAKCPLGPSSHSQRGNPPSTEPFAWNAFRSFMTCWPRLRRECSTPWAESSASTRTG